MPQGKAFSLGKIWQPEILIEEDETPDSSVELVVARSRLAQDGWKRMEVNGKDSII